MRADNLLLEICKFSKFSFLRNPYYLVKDESLLRRGNQVKPLQEMVSTQFKMQCTWTATVQTDKFACRGRPIISPVVVPKGALFHVEDNFNQQSSLIWNN